MLGTHKRVETNRRPALPLDAGPQFESASCAPPSLSTAVAHPFRSAHISIMPATLTSKGGRVPKAWLWFGGLLVVAALAGFLGLRHPVRIFASAVTSIAADSAGWIDDGASISTYPPEQPVIGNSVTSADIERQVVDAFQLLSTRLTATPTTYFSLSGDMPTQETIWQYPAYFVRLYVTSSLESDGARIEVLAGSYRDFRGDRLAPTADEFKRFSPIPFQSPARFLTNR